MTASERRYTHRYRLEVPLVFCPMNSPWRNGHRAKSINISSRGVYFATSHPVFVGLPVQVILRMPRRIAGTPPSERVFDGRVSHIEWKDVPSGSSGVGVEFFYWETAPESGRADQQQISMGGRGHGETASVSNCRAAGRVCGGE
jgi:hypothetical protein